MRKMCPQVCWCDRWHCKSHVVDVCIHHCSPRPACAAHRQQAVDWLCWLHIVPVCQQLVDHTPANNSSMAWWVHTCMHSRCACYHGLQQTAVQPVNAVQASCLIAVQAAYLMALFHSALLHSNTTCRCPSQGGAARLKLQLIQAGWCLLVCSVCSAFGHRPGRAAVEHLG